MGTDAVTHAAVVDYYGKVLESSKDLKTSACTASGAPPAPLRAAIAQVPAAVTDKFYGCGTPLPLGIDGLSVMDLGSGSGRDSYVAAALVGPSGSVVGVDMTDEQLQTARDNVGAYADTLGYAPNLEFKKGNIEFLKEAGIEDESIDVAISNCVINLSPAKPQVLQGVYDALRWGGEFYFSDIYASRRLPKSVQEHEVLWGECIAGALYTGDFVRICRDVGFTDPRVLSTDIVEVTDPELKEVVGEAVFYSITYRLFKLPGLETECEDYGQVAIYKGTIPGHSHSYVLDDHHVFETGRPVLVCGNSASMVGESWLGRHFDIIGDRTTHFGLFDCSAPSGDVGGASAGAADCGPTLPAGGACC